MKSALISGRYRLESQLGRGSFGVVWRGHDELVDEPVAVKLMPRVTGEDGVRLRAEISALRLLQLPGAVRLIDEGQAEDQTFIVMEIVPGEPFPKHASGGWAEIGDTVLALLEALARVHAQGIVHQDLKPDNVLVDDRGRPTILDFGFSAGRAFRAGRQQTVLGTPRYASPEQILNEVVTARSDLYSVALMVYHALAGTFPHPASTLSEIIQSRTRDTSRPLRERASNVPEHVATVIDAMLQRDPEKRPQSAAVCANQLRGMTPSGQANPLRALCKSSTSTDLSEAALRDLFSGPDRLFHLREDGARELFRRTLGAPQHTSNEVGAWVRAGLAEWNNDVLDIDRRALDRLRGGLQVLVPGHVPTTETSSLNEDQDRLLGWVTLAWPQARLDVLAAASERATSELSNDLEDLVSRGAIRRFEPEGYLAVASSRCLERSDERSRMHHALARVLPANLPERLFHVLRSGEAHHVAEQACHSADSLERSGHPSAAEVALDAAFLRLRDEPIDDRAMLALCQHRVRVAVAQNAPAALDRALYAMSRLTGSDPEIERLTELLRAAIAAMQTDSARALAALDAVGEFEDIQIELVRLSLRMLAARYGTLEREDRVLSDISASANLRDPATHHAVLSWKAHLAYRQGRFEESAALHQRVADGTKGNVRLAALTAAVSALLETFRFDEAFALATRAREQAAARRHPLLEGRATWLSRAALYRSGQSLQPDVALVDAMAQAADRSQVALVALTEAAIAWRESIHDVGRTLAMRAAGLWATCGIDHGSALATALALVCGEPRDEVDVGRIEKVALQCTMPRIAAQIVGLLAASGETVRDAWATSVNAFTDQCAESTRHHRADVISANESRSFLGLDVAR